MATNSVVVVMVFTAIFSSISLGSAKVYTVGDSDGWALSVDYTTWASDKTFYIGDSLVFKYDSSHTVDLVSSTDYDTCTIGNSIASYNSGTTTIALNTTGTHYYICGIMGHCSGGMKLTVNVSSTLSPASAPTPSSIVTADSPTTIPLGTTLPPPSVAGTSNVPVDSSSSVVSPIIGVILCFVTLMYELNILG
ncbi:hypothetical protein QVD17_38341 [Tagetes erecta]|uniref:Phytocyanin domain-containing protein n=1 Tax=Tagetes erecta TaxID=13708 RepID=A0AAD8JMZ9_TARER|nr:hypothetical protein QVD17_38341 [Tagetes erecta]